VQEYIPGDSLKLLLDGGKRRTEKEVRSFAVEVLNILIYLHELSPPVIHRDIKPSNLIRGINKEIYLVDFGAVQDRSKAEGVTFTVVGTSGYAPPEQLWGKAVPASDLYALGATLIHLLTGTSPADLPQRRMRIQFRDKVRINPNFADWIERLVQPAPEKRFSTARQALDALSLSTVSPGLSGWEAGKEPAFYGSNREKVVDGKGMNSAWGCLVVSVAGLILLLSLFILLIVWDEAERERETHGDCWSNPEKCR